ncbi:MAG: hypothetical protein O7F72_04880 [Proteobacteria bacterium]|nr:hypothetical protein [Pseudomonadota bacterium]
MIPDSSNLKATMLIEYPDIEQRPVKLKKTAWHRGQDLCAGGRA